ncbi:MAG: restriction endonuclease subunit S [Tenuifilaceae bacterium]|jgi:type I restriction enzyme S subunit|nr:restriction endonuclease subunit S [Bacteroidales bacterium]MDI9515579.1 restriction endonuclease subunit S [Bacteroidota bacterium]NLH55778.1 restriction endonuclease subunit S [Rikenellaceae bacterium]HNV81385.1 restriction endonuclease subunit S [Tenuifilaceae bacterium]MZP81764.1 restriction endonuclease subunit S [Bacteroidales bacterium]
MEKGFKNTEVGVIPEDWEVKLFNEFASINGRVGWKGYTKRDLRQSGPYAIGAKHIDKSNRLDLSEPTHLTREKYLESPEIMVYIDDILIVQRGSIGKVVLIDKEIGEATINPSMVILRLWENLPSYVFYYLISFDGQRQTVFDTSSTGVPMITQKQIANFKIPLPPTKAEQTAIATALNDADALIQKLEQLIAKKRLIKTGAMQELLKPKEGWEVKKLGEVADIVGGGTPSTFNSSFWNGDINWFTPSEIGDSKYSFESSRKITNEGLKNSSARLLPVGTILLTSRASIGDASILMIESCTNQGFQSLVVKEENSNEFLYYLILTLKQVILQNASGSTFLEISPTKLKSIEIIIPKSVEQTRIAQILSDMDNEIAALEKQLEKYKMIKQGMMQVLLTGKIRLDYDL